MNDSKIFNNSILNIIDETLSSMKEWPYPPLYESLCQQKAMVLFEEKRKKEAVAYFVEAIGVSVRQKFLTAGTQIYTGSSQSEDVDKKGPVFSPTYLKFGGPIDPDSPLGYINRLRDLPSEWTIVQLSELQCSMSLLASRSSRNSSRFNPLVMCRLGCGSRAQEMELCYVRRPMPMPYRNDADMLEELNSIAEDYISRPKFGTISSYSKRKAEINDRFKNLLESVEQWLGENRCIFLGRMKNTILEAEVNKSISHLAQSLKVPKDSESMFSLLVQSSKLLKDNELKNGLDKFLPKGMGTRISQLKAAVKSVRAIDENFECKNGESLSIIPRHHVVLILDKRLCQVSWESIDILRRQPASRMPCLAITQAMYLSPQRKKQLDPKSVYFVVDPDNNLSATARRIAPVVLARPSWVGMVSKAPSKQFIEQVLKKQDVYLYCGHGAGLHILPPIERIQCHSVAILVGCNSSDVNKLGNYWELHGAPINFIQSGSPATLGMLHAVLDRDADILTVYLLDSWMPPGNLEEYKKKMKLVDKEYKSVLSNNEPCKQLHLALSVARQTAYCSFTAASFVAYGLPVTVVNHA